MRIRDGLVDMDPELPIDSFKLPIVVQDTVSSQAGEIEQAHDEVVHEFLGQGDELALVVDVPLLSDDVVLLGGLDIGHIQNDLTEVQPIDLGKIAQTHVELVGGLAQDGCFHMIIYRVPGQRTPLQPRSDLQSTNVQQHLIVLEGRLEGGEGSSCSLLGVVDHVGIGYDFT